MKIKYDDEKDRVQVRIKSGGTEVIHWMEPEALPSVKNDLNRALVNSGVRRPQDVYGDNDE